MDTVHGTQVVCTHVCGGQLCSGVLRGAQRQHTGIHGGLAMLEDEREAEGEGREWKGGVEQGVVGRGKGRGEAGLSGLCCPSQTIH